MYLLQFKDFGIELPPRFRKLPNLMGFQCNLDNNAEYARFFQIVYPV